MTNQKSRRTRQEADRSNSRNRAEKLAARRALRQTVGERKQILPTPEREGFYRYWMNDTGSRIQDAMKIGWTPVKDENQSLGTEEAFERNKTDVGYRMDVGNGVTAILMEIPLEDYEADMELRADENTAVEEQMGIELQQKFFQKERLSIKQGE